MGVVLTMAVLFLFFGDFKASLIVGASMPISLFLTLILMSMMGFSMNIVTLGSLVIAIGMMVDASIVVIELFPKTEEYTGSETSRPRGGKRSGGSLSPPPPPPHGCSGAGRFEGPVRTDV